MDLVEFLRQRLDDDERWAQMLMEDPRPEPVMTYLGLGPARVLRDVESRRGIMDIHEPIKETWAPNACHGCGYSGPCDDPITEDINDCPVLRLLALPYADHPAYDEAWKP